MQGFDELALELLEAGYHLVFWVEIECAHHGAFRGTAAWDGQDVYKRQPLHRRCRAIVGFPALR